MNTLLIAVLRLVAALLDALPYRVALVVARLAPAAVVQHHQSRAYSAALWMEAAEEHGEENTLKYAQAQLLMALPWV